MGSGTLSHSGGCCSSEVSATVLRHTLISYSARSEAADFEGDYSRIAILIT
jgi:hypothetical protein